MNGRPNEDLAEFLSLQRALVGRYSLVRELGRGGMGVVFLARDVALDRPVAIKLLPPALAADGRYRSQFLREARLAAGLAHPNIVPIHGVEEQDDLVWFVMGYVEGESLGARVRRLGPLPVHEAVQVVRQAALGLAHAHARGVVHRDVKPDNILIERDTGRVLVTDFGIARSAHDGDASGAVRGGTPHYLSPEQAEGASGDARSDLYALGVTAWFALTGRHPHDGASVPALLVAKVSAAAPSIHLQRDDLGPHLTAAIDRCLERDPARRWPDLEQFGKALDGLGAGRPIPPVVRAFVRPTLSLGHDAALSAGISLSAVAVMGILQAQGGFFNAIFAQAVMLPICAVAASFGIIRAAQSAVAAVDVVREGHDHAAVAAAVRDELRERELEADLRPAAARRRDAFYWGTLGTAKSALAIAVTASNLPGWITVPAAAAAAIVPALTWLKVRTLLRPGHGRWPGWLQGRVGRSVFSLIARVTRRRQPHQLAATPTALALGGEISELYEALPDEARSAVGDLPQLVGRLQREAELLRSRPRSERSDARLATIATALETLRLELLSLEAGLSSIPDVTLALDQARRLGERVDDMVGPLPEITPA